jgi:hypothetical protein
MGEADYYEIEYSEFNTMTGWGAFVPVPPGSLDQFNRMYYIFGGSPPVQVLHHTFAPTPKDGRLVYESKPHFEATLPPLHLCMEQCNQLFTWSTRSGVWADTKYKLRIKGYKEQPDHSLTPEPLPGCGVDQPNEILVTLDNRPDPDPFHPASSPTHPCGPLTVHACSVEPDVDVEQVRLVRAGGGVVLIEPCRFYRLQPGDSIDIDVLVYDRSEHLAYWSLITTFGESDRRDLLSGTTITPLDPGVQVGPTYFNALGQGAVQPKWGGGRMRVSITAAQIADKFPYPCCYQLELRAYKRTIVNCSTEYHHNNLTEYSFFLSNRPCEEG